MFRAAWLGASRCSACLINRVPIAAISTSAATKARPPPYVRNRAEYQKQLKELRVQWKKEFDSKSRKALRKDSLGEKKSKQQHEELVKDKELEHARKLKWRDLLDQSRAKVQAANAAIAAENRVQHIAKEMERRKDIVMKQVDESANFIVGDDAQLRDYIERQIDNPVDYNERIKKR